MDSFLTLFDLIGVLARRRHQTGERCFSSIGLNHTEARLLSVLWHENGAATQETLSNALFIDRSNAGRAMKRLEQEGYLVRRNAEADKRANLVEITPKGRKAVVEISKCRKKLVQSFFGELSQAEASAAAKLLRKALSDEENEIIRTRLEHEARE